MGRGRRWIGRGLGFFWRTRRALVAGLSGPTHPPLSFGDHPMIESTPAGRVSGRSAPQVVLGLVLLVLIVPVAIAVFMAAYAVAEFAQGSHAPMGAPSLLVSVGQLLAVACAAVCGVRFVDPDPLALGGAGRPRWLLCWCWPPGLSWWEGSAWWSERRVKSARRRSGVSEPATARGRRQGAAVPRGAIRVRGLVPTLGR